MLCDNQKSPEKAPLLIDIERNGPNEDSQSTSEPFSWRLLGGVVICGALIACGAVLGTASGGSFTATAPTSSIELPRLGNTMDWRHRVWRGEVEGGDLGHHQPEKRCEVETSNEASKYFIMQTIEALPQLATQLATKADFNHAFDHNEVEAGFLNGARDSEVERPYSLPANGFTKAIPQNGESALVYHFIHVPKAGGTFFDEVLVQVQHALDAKYGSATPGPRAGGIYGAGGWITAPLLDSTAHGVFETAYKMNHSVGPFAIGKLRQSYAAGRRMFSKGSYNMGLCSTTDAPCMYLTVLRDPFDRFMSHYKYSCLEGSEGRAMWLPEWSELGECPLDPMQWFQYTQGDDWTQLFAPGSYPRDSECHVETVKANLQSGCMRYLLTDKLTDGLIKLKTYLPDFASLNPQATKGMFTNDSSSKLTPKLKERLAAYVADEAMMAKIKAGLSHQFKIYDDAVANYESQWTRPLATC